jgi:hypothetical protein
VTRRERDQRGQEWTALKLLLLLLLVLVLELSWVLFFTWSSVWLREH